MIENKSNLPTESKFCISSGITEAEKKKKNLPK
jgi:hypothetical protein